MYKWDAALALKIIEEQRVTYFGGVPTVSGRFISWLSRRLTFRISTRLDRR
jgi:hypothetical protein